MAGSSK